MQLIKLAVNVAKGKPSEDTGTIFEMKYLQMAPQPPPKKTKTRFIRKGSGNYFTEK